MQPLLNLSLAHNSAGFYTEWIHCQKNMLLATNFSTNVLKKDLFWLLKDLVTYREKERQRPYNLWFTLQMATNSRAELDQRQEPGASYRSSGWVRGPKQ